MKLSMCSDFLADRGCAEEHLNNIADAGFDGIQWVHHWSSDFMYTKPEIRAIKGWLKKAHLKMFDLHGTDGIEKKWYSPVEHERQAGVEIVKNRVEMTSELDGNVVVMHVPRLIPDNNRLWSQLMKSLDSLEKLCVRYGVRIAIENIFYDQFNGIARLMKAYSPDFLGICYDSGHGNMGNLGPDHLEKFKDRLIAIHLHDNNGYDDQHRPPFSGTVDWNRVTELIASSTYRGPLTLELIARNSGIKDPREFMRKMYRISKTLAGMIEKKRKAKQR